MKLIVLIASIVYIALSWKGPSELFYNSADCAEGTMVNGVGDPYKKSCPVQNPAGFPIANQYICSKKTQLFTTNTFNGSAVCTGTPSSSVSKPINTCLPFYGKSVKYTCKYDFSGFIAIQIFDKLDVDCTGDVLGTQFYAPEKCTTFTRKKYTIGENSVVWNGFATPDCSGTSVSTGTFVKGDCVVSLANGFHMKYVGVENAHVDEEEETEEQEPIQIPTFMNL